jgi:hypothetical protein
MKKVLFLLLVLSMLISGWGPCSRPLMHGPIDPNVTLDPNGNYVVTYWDYDLPGVYGGVGYREFTEQLLAEFSAEHANIRVEIRWLPWNQGQELLTKALANGSPPDLYADWHGLADFDHMLQLPAGLWLQRSLMPAAQRALTQDGQILSWPRWIWAYGMVIQEKDLGLTPDEVERLMWQRWDWEEFGNWLKEKDLKLEVSDFQGQFSGGVLLASTGRSFDLGWRGPEVYQTFEWLAELKDRGHIRAGGEFQRLAGGKVLLGGFEPALLVWLQDHFQERVILLPIPGFYPDATWYPVKVTSIAQFRQARYKGDEHSLAAAMVAQHLSEGQAKFAPALLAIPGYSDLDWDSAILNRSIYSFLSDAALHGVPFQSVSNKGRAQERKFRSELDTVLKEFWAGKKPHQDVARWLSEYR